MAETGKNLMLTEVAKDQLGGDVTVYNFEVEGDHTYFVGEGEIWVHNADYGGPQGVNRFMSDAHQTDYAGANAEEDRLRSSGNLTAEDSERLRSDLESSLRDRQADYIGDQLDDYREAHDCSESGPCQGISEKENELRQKSDEFVRYKLEQFDSPVIARDFLTGDPVKQPGAKSAEDLPDVKEAVDERISRAEDSMRFKSSTIFNAFEMKAAFEDRGDLDFKTNPEVMCPGKNPSDCMAEVKSHGYQDYVRYGTDANGKPVVLQQSDLGNMAYGDFTNRFGGFDLGSPTDPPRFEGWPGRTTYGSGHYRQTGSWEEYDRPRDQRAMEHGYKCGMNVAENCSTSNTGYPYGNEKNHRVKRYQTPFGDYGPSYYIGSDD